MPSVQAATDSHLRREPGLTGQEQLLAARLTTYLCLCGVEISPSIKLQVIAIAEATLAEGARPPVPATTQSTGVPAEVVQQGLARLNRQLGLPARPAPVAAPQFKRRSIGYRHYG